MTIFLKIICDYLNKELTDYIGSSSAADKSYTNYLCQTVSLGRDPHLSEEKKTIATALMYKISAFALPPEAKIETESPTKEGEPKKDGDKKDNTLEADDASQDNNSKKNGIIEEDDLENEGANKGNDLEAESIKGKEKELASPATSHASTLVPIAQPSLDYITASQIIKLLDETKKTAKKISSEHNYNEGSFGPLIIKMTNVLDAFLKKLEEMQLQDIPYDADPYNKFCYHLASYLFKNTLAELHPSALAKLINNPRLTNSCMLTKDKESLVKNGIIACREDLETLDKQHTKYPETRRKRIIEHIHTLKDQNEGKVNEHRTTISIPFKFIFFSTLSVDAGKIGPASGMLKDCLDRAEEEIKITNLEHIKEHLSSLTM